ncbi:MAG TPA: hypothetical protein VFU22_19895 [Roseiflexaceae bacterium]|nr:hypothetical protein [Roseiflexaceae bacterium]
MERSRLRTLLGIGLIVIGVLFLSQALARPAIAPLPALPALPPLPPVPALPALPRPPALPPMPPAPPLLAAPALHLRAWVNPPLLLLGLAVLAIVWHRRGGCGARTE